MVCINFRYLHGLDFPPKICTLEMLKLSREMSLLNMIWEKYFPFRLVMFATGSQESFEIW